VEALDDRGGLLPDRQVRRAHVVVLNPLVRPLFFDAVEQRLELANDRHVAVDADQVGRAIQPRLGLGIGHIRIDHDLFAAQHRWFPHLHGIDWNRLGHGLLSVISSC